jgi:hypothetical protein
VATTLPTATSADLDRLARHYAFRGEEEVAGFIQANPEVIAPLLDAIAVVPRYFGADTPLALEVERDRDARDDVRLFALIQTDLEVAPSLERLRRFDEEWWAETSRHTSRRLMFDLEYR